jgi:hypothetical protein
MRQEWRARTCSDATMISDGDPIAEEAMFAQACQTLKS